MGHTNESLNTEGDCTVSCYFFLKMKSRDRSFKGALNISPEECQGQAPVFLGQWTGPVFHLGIRKVNIMGKTSETLENPSPDFSQ